MTTTSSSGTLLTDSTNVSSEPVASDATLVIQTDPQQSNIHQEPPSSPNKNKSSSSSDDVKVVDPRDRRLVYVSGVQLLLGGMILIWAMTVISHEASLGGASAAAAFIAGVTALAGGLTGLLARRSKRRNKRAHRSATMTVALAAITVAACSLVLALSATGLLRDGSRPAQQVTWAALLSNTCLLLTAGLLAACSVASGALWRRDAGICTTRGPKRHVYDEEPLPGTPPAPHKVSKWLGQQHPAGQLFMISAMPPPSGRAGSVYSGTGGSPPPHIIPLHVPPPPMAMQPYMLPSPIGPPMGPPMGPPPCMLHGAMTLPDRRERRRSRKHARRMSAGQPVSYPSVEMLAEPKDEAEVAEAAERAERAATRRQRQPNALTEEEVERTYTGLDRAIAEQFITEMEKHRSPCEEFAEEEDPRRRVSTTSSARLMTHRPPIDNNIEETF